MLFTAGRALTSSGLQGEAAIVKHRRVKLGVTLAVTYELKAGDCSETRIVPSGSIA